MENVHLDMMLLLFIKGYKIKTEVTESSQLVKGIQDNLAKIQRNLDIIQDQKTNLQELVTDFQYKTKLFSQQATASLKEIQDIWQPSKND